MVHVITRVTGPQTSYRVELQSFAVTNQGLIYDNKAVVDHAVHLSHRGCSDMDLHLTILEETQSKPLRSTWVPSHRNIAKAKTKEERIEIKCNKEVDRLAKTATRLLPPTISTVSAGGSTGGPGGPPLCGSKDPPTGVLQGEKFSTHTH